MPKNNSFFLKPFFVLISAFILSGCSVWENFTTYFNLYYNTKDKFQEAENAIRQQRKNLFEFEQPNVTGNVPQLLNGVIEKCSKILQFHSSSSYVDDALLMLGKSFYYTKNYQKALRKFQELAITLPESDLNIENELWIAKTQMRLKNFKEGLDILGKVRKLAIDEGEDEIIKESFVEEIVYLINLENYLQAVSLINEFLEVSDDDAVNAEVVYELGKLYIKLNDMANAQNAFNQVFEYEPAFEVELNAKLELVTVLREMNQNEKALAILESMKDENKYSDSYDKIELEMGVTLNNLNRTEEAVDILIKVDTTYTNSINSGIAKFKLGEIFEYKYQNFDSASYYYSKSASSANSVDYLKLASDKSQLFKKYQTLQKNIFDSEKQLAYIHNPDLFIQDSLAFYSDTLSGSETNTPALETPSNIRNRDERTITQTVKTQMKTETKKPPQRPTLSEDSLKSIIAKNKYDLGNLFYNELDIPDSAFYYFKIIVDSFANSAYYTRSLYSLGTYYGDKGAQDKADSIFKYIYDNYKSDNIVNAAASQIKMPLINLSFDPADELYAQAEKKMLAKEFRESVASFYNIFKQFPHSPLAPKALLAAGWILENELRLRDSAAVFYDSINTKYPQSVYALNIRPEITFYKQEIEIRKKAVEDSLKKVELQKSVRSKTDTLQTNTNNKLQTHEKLIDTPSSSEQNQLDSLSRREIQKQDFNKSEFEKTDSINSKINSDRKR